MGLPQYRTEDEAEFVAQQDSGGKEDLDLGRQPRVCVECRLCGSRRSRLVCSDEDIAAQWRFLEQFYRRRWRERNAATATDRLRFTQDYATEIVACTDCGLLYRNPRPRAEAVTKAYEADHYDGAYLWAELEAQRAWARTKMPVVAKHLKKTVKGTTPRILEIGSFVGGFLYEGRERGWDMFGVDPGRDVTAFCRGQRLPVFEGTLEEAKLQPSSFDAIAVWNTFDQLPDPHVLLKHAVPLLRDGGLLIVRVPNGACFEWAMRVRAVLPRAIRPPLDLALAFNNLLTFPYLYGYSADQLERLTASYGFRLLACLPDQLSSTPAGQLTWWAKWEEQALKSLCRAAAAVWRDGRSHRYRSAPWLDCFFERACAEEDRLGTAKMRLGVVPVYSPLVFEDTDSDRRGMWWDREGGLP
jgi:SAM-dependent methyltransferase